MKSYKKMMIMVSAAALCFTAAVSVAEAGSIFAEEENTGDDNGGFASEWVTDADGRIYYYNESGIKVTGEQEIEDELYLFSKNGVLKTGWRTVGGKRRYYDPDTGKPIYGSLNVCGKEFRIEPEQGKLTDSVFADDKGDLYITGEKGDVITEEGFIESNNAFYYVTSAGILADGDIMIDGVPYVFDENGREKLGWSTAYGKEYYYDPDTGEAKHGLINIQGYLYYIDPEEGKKNGIIDIDGVEYYFSEENDQLQTGLIDIKGNIKYFYSDGTYAVGITNINGTDYLFNEKGTRLSGLNTIDGKLCYADENGAVVKGIKEVDGESYCFGDDYSAQTGFIKNGSDTYLFGDDFKMAKGLTQYNGKHYCFDTTTGKMLTGKLLINGKRYYFSDADGTMQTGWITIGNDKYYCGADGVAVTGIKEIDGKKYYFHKDTSIMTSGRLLIDGKKYYFGSNGAMVCGWVTLDDGKYYFGNDGVMVTGWKDIGDKKYYFNPTTGIMEKDKMVGDYNLASDGHAIPLSAVQKRAKSIISSIGTSKSAIYNYVCNNNKYRFIENTRSLAQIESKGWSYFANYSLDNRYVVCYYFAAVTDLLFKQAGYQSRIVYGTGRGSGDHYWNQVYDASSNTWVNYDTCNGYSGVTFGYLQSQNYTFYKYVYPKFY